MNVKLRGIIIVTQLLVTSTLFAQDEAVIAVKARLDRSNSFHFNLGAATSLGQNNYKGGTLVGLGYQKRLNRIISAGASISYSTYRVDYYNFMTDKYPDEVWQNDQPTNFYYTASQAQYYLVNLSGGDLKQASVGALIKINFVPIKANTIASFYVAIAPSLVYATLEQVNSNINFFEHPTIDDYIQINNTSFVSASEQSTWTGGATLSAGVEFFPAGLFSFYVQADYGYIFSVPFVDTSLYMEDRVTEQPYYNPFVDYPMTADFPLSKDEGFSTFNFQLGLVYNF